MGVSILTVSECPRFPGAHSRGPGGAALCDGIALIHPAEHQCQVLSHLPVVAEFISTARATGGRVLVRGTKEMVQTCLTDLHVISLVGPSSTPPGTPPAGCGTNQRDEATPVSD